MNDVMKEPIGFVNMQDITACVCSYDDTTNFAMCIEELSELQKALCKHIRFGTDITKYDVVEELSDVLSVCSMIKQMFDITDEEVKKMIEYKNARNISRLPQDSAVYFVEDSCRVITEEFDYKCLDVHQEPIPYLPLIGCTISPIMRIYNQMIFTLNTPQINEGKYLCIASSQDIANCTELLDKEVSNE